jgi:hypothetical protein
MSELKRYEINTVGDLNKILTNDFLDEYVPHVGANTATGLLRVALMYSDFEKYFQVKPDWSLIPRGVVDILAKKYAREVIDQVLAKHEIDVADIDDTDDTEGRRPTKRRKKK